MITKEEIEKEIKNKSDFLKLEYLEKISKEDIPIEIKKFVHSKIAEIYANKKMYRSAAQNMEIVASLSITFKDKINAYLKEMVYWIMVEDYNEAEKSMNKALVNANTKEKEEIKKYVKEVYIKQAKIYERKGLRTKAIKIYEKLLNLNFKDNEIIEKLIELNEKIGRIEEARKYNHLKLDIS